MKVRFLFLYLIFTLTILSGAQWQKTFAQSSDILVNIIPPNPAPHENVNIVLKSFAYNIDSVLISWSIDGKNVSSGIGKKILTLTAPSAGNETKVVATLSLPDGTIETVILVKPSVMILLFQANDSYTPPFYRGKALATLDSEIKVVAMPEIRSGGGIIDSKNLVYAWKQDYTNKVAGSGYGRNSFTFINDYLENSSSVSVVATTTDQKYSSSASITVGARDPKLIFYKNDGDLGTIWENALADIHQIQEKEVVEAVPYFLSPKELYHPALIWKWFINDNSISLSSFKKNLMPLQVEERMRGKSKLRLEIENQDKIFQTITKEIEIEF